ncbi:stress response protein nst1-like [Solenopsis invicta]|uniref:stress response protein nst1-like n=1 Tax=Solenopsis invicta TaxID=13686 RepID=UPI00193D1A40|nr:stress response protein nst1-like [Solenopsis invicta]
MCETWVEESGWEHLKDRMPESHEWICSFARKEKNKGRARGGFIIGKRKEEVGESNRITIIKEKEGMVMTEIAWENEKQKIISVYGAQGGKDLKKKLVELIGEEEEGNIIIGGDFNVRIGELGDYVIVRVDIRDRIYKFRVGDRVDSDHMPLEMEFSGGEEEMDPKEEQEQEEEEDVKIETILWDDKAKVMYAERTEELCNTEELEEKESDTLEEEWEKIKKIVKEAMVKKRIKRRKKELGHKNWWDRSCTRKKREVKRIYKKWRKGRIGRDRYMKEKRNLKELLEKKQTEKRRKEEEELRKMKNEADNEVWKYINRKRGRRTTTDNKIGKEEWRKHFMDLDGSEMGLMERRIRREEKQQQEKEEEEIVEAEIIKAVGKLKVKKAAGIDGIPAEAWKYAGKELWKRLVKIMKRIWYTGKMPNDWRMSIIMPLYKSGEKEKASNYRGISILCSAYKIYAEIIRNRLEMEVED